jgi:hypothetical protein
LSSGRAAQTTIRSAARGLGRARFQTGYWTWLSGGGKLTGLSMLVFDSEENARAAGERVSAIAADAADDVTLDSVEVREVVASA